jgi:hypothetical protein
MADATGATLQLLFIMAGAILGSLATAIDSDTERIKWAEFLKTLLFLPLVVIPVLLIHPPTISEWFLFGIFGAVATGSIRRWTGTNRAEVQAVLRNVQEAKAAVERTPEKARPVWELSSARLELYFQRNLSQIRSMFWITVAVLFAGFGLISYGVSQAFRGAQIQAALLATASGVVTEFIAATFLVLYKSTLNQASGYVEALERINAVGMALQIVDTIPDSSIDLKNQSKAELSSRILETFIAHQNKPDRKAPVSRRSSAGAG